MRLHKLPTPELAKAAGIGVLTALLLTTVMLLATRTGISPLPKPLGLAFAEALVGRALPLPVGLLFHVAYVTFWSVAYAALFRDGLSLPRALALAGVLWIAVLVVFFPVVGWGFLGLAIGPELIVASLVLHILFALFIWGLSRAAFNSGG